MDVSFTQEEQDYRAQVQQFLTAHPPESFATQGMDAGYGSGAYSHDFLVALAKQGWLTQCWPLAFGGKALAYTYRLILLEELAKAGAPFAALNSCDQTADVIIEFGTDALQAEVLPRIARGEATFWQGFSEPNAGSDLLALRTEAVRDGDDYVINGHKIWSSNAGLADYGFVIARTARDAPRHKGVSAFIVPNRLPGIESRPINSLTGQPYHYEVFLDNVRVHKSYLLGEENGGFPQLLKGLDADRFWARFYKPPYLRRFLNKLIHYANTETRNGQRLSTDTAVRRQFATFSTELDVLQTLFYRTGWMIGNDHPTPYETAMYKLQVDELGQRIATFGVDLLGVHASSTSTDAAAPLSGEVAHIYQICWGQTIAGGTSEILRNTVATRGLGLPRPKRGPGS
ncbi:MAG: acyl-CoA dehydrogenase family protein [Gammaproteobacteria bacterium]|nr:acyl-CoA dehydrogenase family protein [Gammaproteobacteria bacterium]